MKIVKHLDVIEISGSELHAILRDAIYKLHGRELANISWGNVVDVQQIGCSPYKDVNLNATLKPESKA